MSNSILSESRLMGFVASTKPEEAKRFYGETLGLDFISEDQFALAFALHQNQMLRVQKLPQFQPQQFTVCGWQVDDISAAVTELAVRGVKFEQYGFPFQDARGIATFEGGDQVAWFKDPDGNTLSIAQIAAQIIGK